MRCYKWRVTAQQAQSCWHSSYYLLYLVSVNSNLAETSSRVTNESTSDIFAAAKLFFSKYQMTNRRRGWIPQLYLGHDNLLFASFTAPSLQFFVSFTPIWLCGASALDHCCSKEVQTKKVTGMPEIVVLYPILIYLFSVIYKQYDPIQCALFYLGWMWDLELLRFYIHLQIQHVYRRFFGLIPLRVFVSESQGNCVLTRD